MSIDDDIVCMHCIQDAAREESREVVRALQLMGIETVMLTWDNRSSALATGREVGLAEEDIRSQLLPKKKMNIIAELKFSKNITNTRSFYLLCAVEMARVLY